jgi:uncharacterized membrane protein YkvA (DUF1232 family)
MKCTAINSTEFSKIFFFKKLKKCACQAGRKLIEPAVVLFYCLQDKETPVRAKAIIISALAYFVLPTDLICDLSPIVGFTDDLTAILTAAELVKTYTTPGHKQKARLVTDQLFKEDA